MEIPFISAKLTATLQALAADESWRANGPCDPNGTAFSGQKLAREALHHLGDLNTLIDEQQIAIERAADDLDDATRALFNAASDIYDLENTLSRNFSDYQSAKSGEDCARAGARWAREAIFSENSGPKWIAAKDVPAEMEGRIAWKWVEDKHGADEPWLDKIRLGDGPVSEDRRAELLEGVWYRYPVTVPKPPRVG